MSQTPAQRQHGPMESRIDWLWEQAWKAQAEGQHYAFFSAQAAADLNDFAAQIAGGPQTVLQDFSHAKVADLSNRSHFESHVADIRAYRDLMQFAMETTSTELNRLNFYTVQSLGLANGASALGALAYLGQHQGSAPGGMVCALIFAAIGFITILLSCHIAVNKMLPLLELIVQLSLPRMSEVDRKAKVDKFNLLRANVRLIPRILAYVSTALLCAALASGAYALL